MTAPPLVGALKTRVLTASAAESAKSSVHVPAYAPGDTKEMGTYSEAPTQRGVAPSVKAVVAGCAVPPCLNVKDAAEKDAMGHTPAKVVRPVVATNLMYTSGSWGSSATPGATAANVVAVR